MSQNFVYIPQRLVYYRQRSNSISSAFSPKNMDLLKGNGERLKFIQDKYPQLYNQALREQWLHAFQFMKLAENATKDITELYQTYLKEFTAQYRNDLEQALKEDAYKRTLYFIYTHCRSLYPIFSLLEKVYYRFLPPVYKSVKY